LYLFPYHHRPGSQVPEPVADSDYQVLESEASVVRMVFEMHTKQQLNIRAIARVIEPTRDSNTNRKDAVGAIDAVGHPAQSGIPSQDPATEKPNSSRDSASHGAAAAVLTLRYHFTSITL
jgi:hypothetical protein